jgi:CBS domain-containing protein
VGNNVVNISVSALVTTFAIEYFSSQAVGYATGLLTLVILIFGEITPKQLALTHNMKIAVFMAYPIRFISIVLFPVVWLLRQFSSLITRLFASHAEPAITTEGVMHMVDAAEDEGLVDQYESDLMQRAIHFSETQVRTIMTHRTNVFCISDELTIRDAFPSIVKSGFSRVPVFHASAENIIGIVLVRDILRAQLEKRMDKSISTILRKPIFVPEQMHLEDVFFLFKKDKLQQAIVLDEYGGFSGVVTMKTWPSSSSANSTMSMSEGSPTGLSSVSRCRYFPGDGRHSIPAVHRRAGSLGRPPEAEDFHCCRLCFGVDRGHSPRGGCCPVSFRNLSHHLHEGKQNGGCGIFPTIDDGTLL